jgi:uncharacterized lipoprotein YddW (UPF0748 family)
MALTRLSSDQRQKLLATLATAAITAFALLAALLVGLPSPRGSNSAAARVEHHTCAGQRVTAPRSLRGMWITTVRNADWPSRPGLERTAAEAEYRSLLELARRLNFNAVFVQVRPSGDAFWPSRYAPWSQWLTGSVESKDPGWDPMAFLVSETHRYGLEFHAWFNPYRASRFASDLDRFPADHPLRSHPDWSVTHPPNDPEALLYYNPGVPEARRYVEDSILDAVARYDLDGVHFDDFFYPYPGEGQEFGDAAAFAKYGGGFPSKADWRRDNVNRLVKEMNQRIKDLKPWVKFGISPFGIWRNASTDPKGSDTKGLQSYDAIYADSRLWVREQWLDYIVPQVYWNIGFGIADYAKLVPWWANIVAGTRVQLYIGQADYRIGSSGAWSDPAELDRQLALNQSHQVSGSVHFTARDLRADKLGAVSRYVAAHHATPAFPPLMAQLPANVPGPPTIVSVRRGSSGAVTVRWRPGPAPAAVSYAVYRVPTTSSTAAEIGSGSPEPSASSGGQPDPVGELVWVGRTSGKGEQRWVDTTAPEGRGYAYCVTAIDRGWNESPASAATRTR